MFFGFLGKHGVSLADNEVYSFVGDLRDLVAGNARKEAALNSALEDSNLAIKESPKPVYFNDTSNQALHIAISGADGSESIGVADPDWGAFDTDTA